MGRKDVSGDDWGDIFAAAVNGVHFGKNEGVVDIALGSTAWSAKTVKLSNPVSMNRVRLISGRNDPIFSFGNRDFFSDVQETGAPVLRIWNSRVEEATQQYSHLRTIVLIRDMDRLQFKIFEQQTVEFDPADYVWRLNKRNNFEGRSVQGDAHAFTWQPHGSQFTIIRQVSGSARSFQVRKPNALDVEVVLRNVGYSSDWVEYL